MSRSSLISVVNKLNSSPLHFVSLRHLFNLSPNIMSPSLAHFVKSLPHVDCIHLRNAISQALVFDANDCFCAVSDAFAASLAANAARCLRIDSANISSLSDDATPDAESDPRLHGQNAGTT